MKVQDLMTQDVRTCTPDDSLHVVARLMWEGDLGCVPVVDADRIAGMITDRDLCMAAYTSGQPLHSLRVRDAMSTSVSSCEPDASLATAERLMRDHQVHRLAVTDADGRLIGILTLNDLAQEAARQRARRTTEVCADEIAMTLADIGRPRQSRSRTRRPSGIVGFFSPAARPERHPSPAR